MIKKITLANVACYKDTVSLETDKNVNLIYGLNGVGKSTLSDYLRNVDSPRYFDCQIEYEENKEIPEILVYNEHYVEENFYVKESQKGVFSISQTNVAAQKEIERLSKELDSIKATHQTNVQTFNQTKENWISTKGGYEAKFWQIKAKYTGGDRIFDYCLRGHMSSKSDFMDFFVHRVSTNSANTTVDDLKTQLANLATFSGNPIPILSEIRLNLSNIEKNNIFTEVLTGNKNSKVAKLIDELNNADWVHKGLSYNSPSVCPFCQRPYEDSQILLELKEYFNEKYEESLQELQNLRASYNSIASSIVDMSSQFENKVIRILQSKYKEALDKLQRVVDKNLSFIDKKIQNPSTPITLVSTDSLIEQVNLVIREANKIIVDLNSKLSKVEEEKQKIKDVFWDIQQEIYEVDIKSYKEQETKYLESIESYQREENEFNAKSIELNSKIEDEGSKIVNLQTAVDNINGMLLDMGIVDFRVISDEEKGMYRIIRGDEDAHIFKTLSEGEKTIISILYFIETCKGSFVKGATVSDRIIVIDDPISSLSTMFLFNIGRLIRDKFYPTYKANDPKIVDSYKCEQLFILTHNLYFFYEMAEMNSKKRKATQKLFRIVKTESGSQIDNLHYEQIQTDYQMYWTLIQNPHEHPVVIANCMRNIIEYFFGFIRKVDLDNVFADTRFKDVKYQGFLRYIQRESHSKGQNISDFKDFDYDNLLSVFKSIFELSGYKEHFDEMMKIQ